MLKNGEGRLVLTREFYLREANIVAPELLGKLLVHKTGQGITAGVIVEVESYIQYLRTSFLLQCCDKPGNKTRSGIGASFRTCTWN